MFLYPFLLNFPKLKSFSINWDHLAAVMRKRVASATAISGQNLSPKKWVKVCVCGRCQLVRGKVRTVANYLFLLLLFIISFFPYSILHSNSFKWVVGKRTQIHGHLLRQQHVSLPHKSYLQGKFVSVCACLCVSMCVQCSSSTHSFAAISLSKFELLLLLSHFLPPFTLAMTKVVG